MINKEIVIKNHNIKLERIIILQKGKKFLLTSSLFYYLNSNIYQGKDNYMKKIFHYAYNRKYSFDFHRLCYDGKIIINKDVKRLRDLYLLYDINHWDKKIKLISLQDEENIKYNGAVRFTDTTAFIELINDDVKIDFQSLTMKTTKKELNKVVSNWNGLLHNSNIKLDAIDNKVMLPLGNYVIIDNKKYMVLLIMKKKFYYLYYKNINNNKINDNIYVIKMNELKESNTILDITEEEYTMLEKEYRMFLEKRSYE